MFKHYIFAALPIASSIVLYLNKKPTYTWIKRILITGLIVLMLGLLSIWYIFSKKFSDTADERAVYTVTANDFIREFELNDHLANTKYAEKIITVNGMVSEVERADTTTNVKMSGASTGSYIIFAFQKDSQAEAAKIKPGDKLSVKGSCSSGAYSSILETEFISFKRCVINKHGP